MMRELRVEDALLYLDQVKVEFGDRPHIYNEFLDIMKTFKTQQIDTPGVIRRVSNLFQGNRKLVLGFNTFLPEGYKIELPARGDGPPVAVFRAPGSSVTHVLNQGPPPAGSPGAQQPPIPALSSEGAMPPSAQGHGQVAGIQPPALGAARGMRPVQHSMGMPSMQPPHAQQQQPPPPRVAPTPQPPQQAQQQPPMRAGGPSPHQQPQPLEQARGPAPPAGGPQRQPPPAGMPPGRGPQPPPAPMSQQQPPQAAPGPPPPHMAPPPHGMGGMPMQQQPQAPPPAQQQPPFQQQQQQQQEAPAPMEFDHAINYVTTIKRRFANEPETYKKFLEILHTYQKEQRGIKEVLDEVSALFGDHPDLLKEFTYFLPDAVQGQAKAQLDQVVKESEARKRAQAKQAIMYQAQGMQKQAQRTPAREYPSGAPPIPFGATQGRSIDREQTIIRGTHFGVVSFDPVRPPRRNELTPAQKAAKSGRPNTVPALPRLPDSTEASFFERAKGHLLRRELAADGGRAKSRHNPYTEFIKCLHLFAAGILNKDELILLLRGLFTQGHAPKSGANPGASNPYLATDAAELLRELEEIIIGRGPYAEQERALKDKSKYGGICSREYDFSGCEQPTPSYRMYPSDYPRSLFFSHPGQGDDDAALLNKTVLCVGADAGSRRRAASRTIEDFDGIRVRCNVYEETMARIEDERYEVDITIDRNSQAMRQLEPFVEEVQRLREQEENDGQPIGRLQYKLNRYAMNSLHVNAIGRIYGEQGDEVLQHLLRNPLIVLPIVYQRLKQKDAEWRAAKAQMMDRWNAGCEANYEGSRDVLCFFYRKELERTFATGSLLEECKKARVHCKRPDKRLDHPATRPFVPTFGLYSQDTDARIFEPFVSVKSQVNASHKDAISLVIEQLHESDISEHDRERIGRILAEFLVPWFGYPAYWVMAEIRESFLGRLNPHIVKMAPGQTVQTIFGTGTIMSVIDDSHQGPPDGADGTAKYRVKLPFGVGHLGPSAILHAVPSTDTPYVRHDGVMVRDESLLENGGSLSSGKLDEKYRLLFATESAYVFMRLYLLLCCVLSDARAHCESSTTPYHDPFPKDPAESARKLTYSDVIVALKKVLSEKMDPKDCESIGRKVLPDKVYEVAALPKLIRRCTDSLLKVAQEDVLLHLYDLCHLDGPLDPVSVRTHCLATAPDAAYRIQYDTASNVTFFSYVPKNVPLLTAVSVGQEEEEEDAADDLEANGDEMEQDEQEDAMEVDNAEPAEEEYDNGDAQPPNKRARR